MLNAALGPCLGGNVESHSCFSYELLKQIPQFNILGENEENSIFFVVLKRMTKQVKTGV